MLECWVHGWEELKMVKLFSLFFQAPFWEHFMKNPLKTHTHTYTKSSLLSQMCVKTYCSSSGQKYKWQPRKGQEAGIKYQPGLSIPTQAPVPPCFPSGGTWTQALQLEQSPALGPTLQQLIASALGWARAHNKMAYPPSRATSGS